MRVTPIPCLSDNYAYLLVCPETKEAAITIDCGWEQGRGRTNADWRGRTVEVGPKNAQVGVDIDGDAFAELVIERIASLG